MLQVPVFDEKGAQIGTESIDEAQLGGELNISLLKQALVMYDAAQRQGTVRQKTRGEVEGSTRKLYKQKGTGRARMGGIRQPVRRGGGRAFPRRPRDFSHAMPKKMRRLARDQAVLARLRASAVAIVDGARFDAPKTKRFAAMLAALGAPSGCVFATAGLDPVIYKSGRNIPRTEIMDVAELNARAILGRPRLLFTREAFARYRDAVAAAGRGGKD